MWHWTRSETGNMAETRPEKLLNNSFETSADDYMNAPRQQHLPGVYILKLNEKVVYVGQSTKVMNRVASHRAARHIKFNQVEIIFCEEDELGTMETELIKKHNPERNKGQYAQRSCPLENVKYYKKGEARIVQIKKGQFQVTRIA
jgi:predicted GIY-YIG superfamily endonuclease